MKHLNFNVLPALSAVHVTLELPRLLGLLLLAATIGVGVCYKATDARNYSYHQEQARADVAEADARAQNAVRRMDDLGRKLWVSRGGYETPESLDRYEVWRKAYVSAGNHKSGEYLKAQGKPLCRPVTPGPVN